MASAAQFEANSLNAASSCGPKTPDGKARSSRNNLKFGLFSTQNCVRPEETAEYTRLSKALWKDLNPVGPVEQMLAVEIVRAAWRLQRCAIAEAEDGANPATQAAVDRARASAHNSMRRLLNDLRQFQSDRWLRAEVLREGFDEQHIGIADAHRVIKGLIANSRLGAQSIGQAIFSPLASAAGEEPAPTIRTQSVGQAILSPASPTEAGQTFPVPPAISAVPVNRTQSPAPSPQPLTARNAPCPCDSGLKYKRCCGAAAPPVLTTSQSSKGAEGPLHTGLR